MGILFRTIVVLIGVVALGAQNVSVFEMGLFVTAGALYQIFGGEQ